MRYYVTNIKYDTDGEDIKLPNSLAIDIPNEDFVKYTADEIDDFISDEISNITGFCHKGFSMTVKPTKFRVGTMDVNGTMEVYDKYFDDETEAYEHFIDVRGDIIAGEHVSTDVWIEKLVEGGEYESTDTYNLDDDIEQSEKNF